MINVARGPHSEVAPIDSLLNQPYLPSRLLIE